MAELILGTLLAIGVLLVGIKMIENFDVGSTIDLDVGFLYYLACGLSVYVVWQVEGISGFNFWFLCGLVGYLVLSSFTDIKTLLIYSLFNYVFFIVGVIYSIINQVDVSGVPIMIGAVVVFWLLGVIKVYGAGDAEIFAVVAIFVMNLSVPSDYILNLLLIFFLAAISSLVLSVSRMGVTKEKLRTKMPFAPGIAIAVMVWLVMFF